MLNKLRNKLAILCGAFLVSGMSGLAYAEDVTFLRCYYRTVPDSKVNSEVTYHWALNPGTDNYYKLVGQWWDINLVLANMFYTDTSHKELTDICNKTLEKKGITAPLVLYSAADTSASYNYLIWNVDSKNNNATGNINRIVSFGDSLSDTSNFINGMGWLKNYGNKSYYGGRFSNEKNWLDYFSAYSNAPVYNWAIGGAATVTKKHYGIVKINGVSDQVDSWLIYMNQNLGDQNPNSNHHYNPQNTLFTMLIGGNDLLQYDTDTATMKQIVKQSIEKLIKGGGKNILLSNLPDVSQVPVFKIRKRSEEEQNVERAKTKARVVAYNNALADLVVELRAVHKDAVNLHMFDAHAMMNRIVENPAKYGITNTTDSCLDLSSEDTNTYQYEQRMRASCSEAPNQADSFLYWDFVHPTTKTHQIIADSVACFAKDKYPVKFSQEVLAKCEAN